MALKPNGETIKVKEQIIEDPASGLTLVFECLGDGLSKLSIHGDLPFGNRDFIFDREGREAGGGTSLAPTKPTWIRAVGDVDNN